MKYFLCVMISLVCCAISSLTLAADNLCIALLNFDTIPVQFSTAADPGYIPVVQPSENKILPRDFMVTCDPIYSTCNIIINSLDGKNITDINSVPMGTQIVYAGHQQYYLNVNANVQCLSSSTLRK